MSSWASTKYKTTNWSAFNEAYDIEPLADIFANHMPFFTAAANRVLWFNHLFNARQVLGQRSTIGFARTGFACCLPVIGFLFRLDRLCCRFDVFQQQLELVRINPFGF